MSRYPFVYKHHTWMCRAPDLAGEIARAAVGEKPPTGTVGYAPTFVENYLPGTRQAGPRVLASQGRAFEIKRGGVVDGLRRLPDDAALEIDQLDEQIADLERQRAVLLDERMLALEVAYPRSTKVLASSLEPQAVAHQRRHADGGEHATKVTKKPRGSR